MAATTSRPNPKPLQAQRAEVVEPDESEVTPDGLRRIEYDGKSYTLPAQEDVDISAIEAFESNQVVKGVRLLLGEEQYAQFREDHRTMGQLAEFLDVLMSVPNS